MEIIKTIIKGRDVTLYWNPDEPSIPSLIEQGVIPIEMAEGGVSYVDSRSIDHHNDLSHMPAACVTALKYRGTINGPISIMVNHVDMDCVLAGALLMDAIPMLPGALSTFVYVAGLLDTDPMNPEVKKNEFAHYKLLVDTWKAAMQGKKDNGWSWLYGLQALLDIIEHREEPAWRLKLKEILTRENERIRQALTDYEDRIESKSTRVILIPESNVPGFDVQFHRLEDYNINSFDGWKHWCLLAYVAAGQNVTISCPNKEIAELAFGKGGLMNVFPKLPSINNKTWGGRESVGGSPRGEVVPREMLKDILDIVESCLVTDVKITMPTSPGQILAKDEIVIGPTPGMPSHETD